jgi:RNA polymerase sigma-70 factor (ECF subfamily)
MITESNDTTLESAAQPATPEVIARLVASHARFLAFLERRVASREAAEDILQEAFVRALTRGDALSNEESAQAWFYRLLRNALVDHYRRKGAEQRALGVVGREPEPVSEAADAALLGTVCQCMGDLIETLKPEYARALREVDLAESDVATFAQGAGITHNNASVRLHRAREALYKQLVVSCGTCATHGCLDCQCDSKKGASSCHQ